MKRRATGSLVLMTGVFAVLVTIGTDGGWSGYLRAAVEASVDPLPAMPTKRSGNRALVALAIGIEQRPGLLRHGAS